MSETKSLCLSGKGVTKIFGFGDNKTVAVDHVDFEFYKGEIVSIVGESGSGKTTLTKMLPQRLSVLKRLLTRLSEKSVF